MEKSSGFRFMDAVKAGFMATVVLTLVMWIFGMNTMKGLGMMLVGADAGMGMVYAAGAGLHFGIGIFFGIVYALFLAPMAFMNGLFKALVFSVVTTAAAYYGAPKLPEVVANIKGEAVEAANPCNPCNPCAAYNPCNPCNPCAAANPCAGDSNKQLMMTWVNHLIFSLALASMYRRRVM